MSAPASGTGPGPIPRIPLNVRLRRHRGRDLAIGYEHSLELSPTAVFIWRQIDGSATVTDIARAVSDEYSIDLQTALSDTRELLDDLASHQIIVWAAATP